jgi:hypothetical protein
MAKKVTRRDRRQTRRANKERAKAGLRPTYESNDSTYKVTISSDVKPIRLGAAKGRDIPLPPSK